MVATSFRSRIGGERSRGSEPSGASSDALAAEVAQLADQIGELPQRLAQLEERLAELAGAVDYVRHVSEGTRSNLAMLARRPEAPHPVRVLFLVHHPEAWYSLAEVYRIMAEAEDFHPVVASLPRHFPGSEDLVDEEHVHERLTAFGVPHLRFKDPDSFNDLDIVRAIDPHLIFRQSQWDGDVPLAFRTPELRFARLALVPYETMNIIENVVGEDGIANSAVDSVYHRSCWRVFCTNERTREVAATASPGSGALQFRVTGHPKADVLRRFAGQDRPADRPFTVLWSAHHSVASDWSKFGTFPASAPAMLRLAREHEDWRFVFSPHPGLLSRMNAAAWPLDSAELRGFREAWDALPNTEFFGGGDYGPLFERSDVLISDGLSWLLEFQLVGKPVLFLERPGHQPFNDLGQRTLAGVHTVATVAQGVGLLESFAAGEPDPLAPAQIDVVADLFGVEGAAERIVATIRSEWAQGLG